MKIKIILLCLATYSFSASISQNLKKYSGEYPSETGEKGFATYTYYEDAKTLNYTKQGHFKYVLKTENSFNEIIEGNFSNGKRTGLWTFNVTMTDYPTQNVYYTGTIQMSANYINGLPDGAWSYSKNLKFRGKKLLYNTYKWTNYETEPVVTVSANFKSGLTVGTLKILNDKSKFNSIIGEFNKNGVIDKTWILRDRTDEIITKFNNGIQLSLIDRISSTGNVIENITDDIEMTKAKNDLLNGVITLKELRKKHIIVDTFSALKNGWYNFSFTLYDNIFNYKNIEGDDTYLNDVNIRKDGVFFIFKKKDVKPLSEISAYQQLEADTTNEINSINSNLELYEQLLRVNEQFLDDDDIEIVKEKMKTLQTKVNRLNIEYCYKMGLKEMEEKKYNNALYYFEKCIEYSKKFNMNFKVEEANNKIIECNTNLKKQN